MIRHCYVCGAEHEEDRGAHLFWSGPYTFALTVYLCSAGCWVTLQWDTPKDLREERLRLALARAAASPK